MQASLIRVLPVANILGEGVQWNAADQAFWWTDIHARRLYRHHLATDSTRHWDLPERLGSFCFPAAGPGIIAAFETGFARFDPETGDLAWLHRPEAGGTGRRFNDGRVDRQGRFWAGTMVEDAAKAGAGTASLWCLDRDGSLHRRVDGIAISNGLGWSVDGTLLHLADSVPGTVTRYRQDTATGALSDPTPWLQLPPGDSPDGATVDGEGGYWSAIWGGSRLSRYRPDGTEDGRILLPVTQPTCVSFGGPGMDVLCVTSARDGLSPGALAAQPQAGHIFLFQGPVRGLEEGRYAG